MHHQMYPQNLLPEKLNYLFLLCVLAAINGILTLTLILQFVRHETPCPLCLLQRLAFFGAGFGLISAFRRGYSPAQTGCVIVFMTYLLTVSVRQSMNHIIGDRGGWIGGTVYGLHLTVWSVIAACIMILMFSLALTAFSVTPALNRRVHSEVFPVIHRLGKYMSLYLIVLCVINLVTVFLQCGFGICHTYTYWILDKTAPLPCQ